MLRAQQWTKQIKSLSPRRNRWSRYIYIYISTYSMTIYNVSGSDKRGGIAGVLGKTRLWRWHSNRDLKWQRKQTGILEKGSLEVGSASGDLLGTCEKWPGDRYSWSTVSQSEKTRKWIQQNSGWVERELILKNLAFPLNDRKLLGYSEQRCDTIWLGF